MALFALIERILTARSPVLELNTERPASQIAAELELEGYRAVVVDRAPVFDKETLLHALYQGCGFPAYFGFNWDALADTLKDTEGHDARPLILLFRDFDLLRKRAPEVAELFLDIVREVGDTPAAAGTLKRLVLLQR